MKTGCFPFIGKYGNNPTTYSALSELALKFDI